MASKISDTEPFRTLRKRKMKKNEEIYPYNYLLFHVSDAHVVLVAAAA